MFVQTRWNIINQQDKDGIRHFIISMVLELAEDPQYQGQNQHVLTKLYGALVSIVKQEWKVSWTNFISDICQSATQS